MRTALSSRYIPRDQLRDFIPWKMSELSSPIHSPDIGLAREAAIDPGKLAKEEGFKLGLAVGFKQGFEAATVETTSHAEKIKDVIDCIQAKAVALDDIVAGELLSLSIEIARQVVRTSIASDTGNILPVIREALAEISSIARHPCIVLNPADMSLVKKEISTEAGMPDCKFIADPTITTGGARIQDDTVEVDATIESRWRRAVARLGRIDDWIK